jgi:hypothetical protein
LVKTNDNHILLTNAFPHLEAISPKNYSDRLDVSGPDLTVTEIAFFSDFWLQAPQKSSKPRDILAYSKPN